MNHDTTNHGGGRETRDPLGLSELPLLDPPADGWASVRAALEQDPEFQQLSQPARTPAARHRGLIMGLAAAACLVAVVSLVLLQGNGLRSPGALDPTGSESLAINDRVEEPLLESTADPTKASAGDAESVRELIALSQGLERRLRTLRDNAGAMPADSAVYLAELEDLIARVDGQISDAPESLDLWSQRVNLMLDIEALFQHQFEREYGHMASL